MEIQPNWFLQTSNFFKNLSDLDFLTILVFYQPWTKRFHLALKNIQSEIPKSLEISVSGFKPCEACTERVWKGKQRETLDSLQKRLHHIDSHQTGDPVWFWSTKMEILKDLFPLMSFLWFLFTQLVEIWSSIKKWWIHWQLKNTLAGWNIWAKWWIEISFFQKPSVLTHQKANLPNQANLIGRTS